MKRWAFLIILVLAIGAPVRADGCVPEYINISIGGTFIFHVPKTCVVIERQNNSTLEPAIGTHIQFEAVTQMAAGVVGMVTAVITGYQITQYPPEYPALYQQPTIYFVKIDGGKEIGIVRDIFEVIP